jgi:hypothetical protein
MKVGIAGSIRCLPYLVCQLVPELFLLSSRGSAKKTLALASDNYLVVPPVVKLPLGRSPKVFHSQEAGSRY